MAAIGMGTPAHAAQFRELSGIDFPLLVAEDASVHKRAGLTGGNWLKVIGPRTWPGIVRGMRAGHGFDMHHTDRSQLGGTFVYGADGSLLWSHKAKSSTDNSSVDEIVAALGQA